MLGLRVKNPNTIIKFHHKDALESAFSLKRHFYGNVAKLQILSIPILLP